MPCEICQRDTSAYQLPDGRSGTYKRCLKCKDIIGPGERVCCADRCKNKCFRLKTTGKLATVCWAHKDAGLLIPCSECGSVFVGPHWKTRCKKCFPLSQRAKEATGDLLALLPSFD